MVISGEECVPQHQMFIGRMVIPMNPQNKEIVKFVPKHRMCYIIWKTLLMEIVEWIFLLQLESEMDG